jgi:hypothetical protein
LNRKALSPARRERLCAVRILSLNGKPERNGAVPIGRGQPGRPGPPGRVTELFPPRRSHPRRALWHIKGHFMKNTGAKRVLHSYSNVMFGRIESSIEPR